MTLGLTGFPGTLDAVSGKFLLPLEMTLELRCFMSDITRLPTTGIGTDKHSILGFPLNCETCGRSRAECQHSVGQGNMHVILRPRR